VNAPVKLVLTRQQAFTSVGYRPEIYHRLQLGATRAGRLTTLTHEATAQTALFDERVVAPVTQMSRKLYACPHIATSYRLIQLNRGGPFTMRGPGDTPGLFALESAMDELSYVLELDPVELRLRNYAEVDPENGSPWTSKSLRSCYLQGAERFGWRIRDPRPRSMFRDGKLVGWGMASSSLDSLLIPASASARFFADGSVLVQSATCDQGTGSYTVMRQIAAEALGITFKQVRFELGDTRMPPAPIAAGSMTAASVGSAVYAAGRALRRRLLALAQADPASPLFAQDTELIATENGRCFLKQDPRKGETYRDILKRHKLVSMDVTERSLPDPERRKYSAYAFGAHFAEVQVDPDLGTVQVTRYVGAFSAGRILNPKMAHSQLIGGITWGIGMALMEETLFDPSTGGILNASLGDYHVPVNADVPDLEAFFIEEYDPFINPIGVKGVGELGLIGSAAAIANAVYHATGKRIRELPITLDKLL
jgi:xanthine dehydrogenase YagR molybdenum-binding subunit